jgi:hypothetical protein
MLPLLCTQAEGESMGLRSGALLKTRHTWTVLCLDPLSLPLDRGSVAGWTSTVRATVPIYSVRATVPSYRVVLQCLHYSICWCCCSTEIPFIHFWSNVQDSKAQHCSYVPCLQQGTWSQSESMGRGRRYLKVPCRGEWIISVTCTWNDDHLVCLDRRML